MSYTIGIIEDVKKELDNIRATIEFEWEANNDIADNINFKIYSLDRSDLIKEIKAEIKEDIVQLSINLLIIDYKLDTLKQLLPSDKLVEYINEIAREFPVIVLTNVPEEGERNDNIDPDKVYAKSIFFKAGTPESNKMVYKLYHNMARYTNERLELKHKLDIAISKLNNATTDDIINPQDYIDVSICEDQYEMYVPTDRSPAESSIDKRTGLEELASIIHDIKEITDKYQSDLD